MTATCPWCDMRLTVQLSRSVEPDAAPDPTQCDHGRPYDGACTECESDVGALMTLLESRALSDEDIRGRLTFAIERRDDPYPGVGGWERYWRTRARNLRRAMTSWGIADDGGEG